MESAAASLASVAAPTLTVETDVSTTAMDAPADERMPTPCWAMASAANPTPARVDSAAVSLVSVVAATLTAVMDASTPATDVGTDTSQVQTVARPPTTQIILVSIDYSSNQVMSFQFTKVLFGLCFHEKL